MEIRNCCFSWLASAVVSFALYALISGLTGNRFLNQALTGLFKGITGVIPFFVASIVGRKPILLVAVTAASVSGYLLSTDIY